MPKFNVTAAEFRVITKIAVRATKELEVDRMATEMDLCATIAQGCAMRLQDLLDAPAASFGHDILGIRRHLNRSTGLLMDHFLPRYAQPESPT